MLVAPLLAEGASGIGALGIDIGSLIVYLVNFGVLLAVLYFFAYKRVLGMLDQRSSRIKESLEEAGRVREESQQQQASMQHALNEGRQEGQRVLAEARQMAEGTWLNFKEDKSRTPIGFREVPVEWERSTTASPLARALGGLGIGGGAPDLLGGLLGGPFR